MERLLDSFISELIKRILWIKNDDEKKLFQSFFVETVKSLPSSPDALLFDNFEGKESFKGKLKQVSDGLIESDKRQLECLIWAHLLLRRLRHVPRCLLPKDICEKCAYRSRPYKCKYCSLELKFKDTKRKHQSKCKWNPHPKAKKEKNSKAHEMRDFSIRLEKLDTLLPI